MGLLAERQVTVENGLRRDCAASGLVEPDRTLASNRARKDVFQPVEADFTGDPDAGLAVGVSAIVTGIEGEEQVGFTDDRLRFQPDPSPSHHQGCGRVAGAATADAVRIGGQGESKQEILGFEGVCREGQRRTFSVIEAASDPKKLIASLSDARRRSGIDTHRPQSRCVEPAALGLVEQVQPIEQVGTAERARVSAAPG